MHRRYVRPRSIGNRLLTTWQESLRTALRTLAIDTKPLQDFHSPSPPHRQRTVSHEPLQDPQTPSSTSGDSADDEASSVNSPLSAVLKRRGSLPAAFIPRPILSSPDSPTPFDNRLSRSHGAVEPRPLQLRRRDSDVTVEDDLPTPRPTLTHPPRVFSHQQVEQDLTRRVRAIKPIPSLMGPNALRASFSVLAGGA